MMIWLHKHSCRWWCFPYKHTKAQRMDHFQKKMFPSIETNQGWANAEQYQTSTQKKQNHEKLKNETHWKSIKVYKDHQCWIVKKKHCRLSYWVWVWFFISFGLYFTWKCKSLSGMWALGAINQTFDLIWPPIRALGFGATIADT